MRKVFIYTDYPSEALDVNTVKEYIGGFGFEVEIVGDLYEKFLQDDKDKLDELVTRLSKIIINEIEIPLEFPSETSGLLKHDELKRLNGNNTYRGIFYDGNWLQRLYFKIIYNSNFFRSHTSDTHIIYTGRLFGTFGQKRYHARVVIMGFPSLISTSGVVEAPARPREYYWARAGLLRSGRDIAELDEIYKDKFIHYDDHRLTNIICSYSLQPIIYDFSGEEFCSNSQCSNFNSHWQEEVIRIQQNRLLCSDCEDKLNWRQL